MNTKVREIEKQRKNRKKGFWFAFVMHTALMVLIAYPFLTQSETPTPDAIQVVTIEYVNFDKASSKPSSRPVAGGKKVAKKVKPVKIKPEPKPKPKSKVKPIPTHKPVLTAPVPEIPVPTTPEPIPESPVEKPQPDATPEIPTDRVPESSSSSEASTSETVSSDKPGTAGEGRVGNSDNGKNKTDGVGTGNDGDDFSGEGIFGRKVTYRADVKKLTKEEGKIVVNLCVNQAGKVIFTDYNRSASTIHTTSLVNQAEACVRRYRFEQDYTAPSRQCGKLTFIFKL